MQKFRCCGAANPKTHDDGKGSLTFQHSGRIDLPSRPIAPLANANSAVNLRVCCNCELTLATWSSGGRTNQIDARGQVSRIKCAKKLGILEFSYARIACVASIINEFKFIITGNETTSACASQNYAANPHDEPFRDALEVDHVRPVSYAPASRRSAFRATKARLNRLSCCRLRQRA